MQIEHVTLEDRGYTSRGQTIAAELHRTHSRRFNGTSWFPAEHAAQQECLAIEQKSLNFL
jgi:hypothetical protein